MTVKKDDILNTMKTLSMDMINNAQSGSYKNMESFSKIIYALYMNVLNINSNDPNWINRDRLIISGKYDPSVLYAMLYQIGYDISVEDLKRYRRVDSFTPGSLVYNPSIGIECSSLLPAASIASAVGLALGQRYIENLCKKEIPKSNLINYYTYVLCTNKDIEDGISYEAFSLASKQKLNKLVVILDMATTLNDSDINQTYSEDLEDRFDALGFNIVESKCNISDITSALKSVKKSDMPSLIVIKSDKKSKFDDSKILTSQEIIELKKKYNLPIEEFTVNDEQLSFAKDSVLSRIVKKYNNWLKEYENARKNDALAALFDLLEKKEVNFNFDCTNYELNDEYAETGIASNNKALNFVASKNHFLVGGSNDLNVYCNAAIEKSRFMTVENPLGRNVAFGSRQNSLGYLAIGLALSGLHVYISTLLTMESVLKNAIKQSILMNLPIYYIFTHDGVSQSEEGVIMQNYDALASLRSIPGFNVYRPCDINEILGSWECLVKAKGPGAICLTKEKMHILKHTNGKYVQYGAYIVRKEKYHLDGVIVSTGSEVATALKAAEELYTNGIDLRVVSMPSIEHFIKQNPIYKEKLLPKDTKIITLEAGSKMSFTGLIGGAYLIGIDTFGTSGKKEETLKFVEFDYNTILMKIKKNIES